MARILIVEDEAHIAEGLQFNLEAEEHDVEVVSSGQGAIDRLSRSSTASPGPAESDEAAPDGGADGQPPIDLLLLDLMLPDVSGFEVARRARASGNYVAILMLTARDDPQDVVRGLEEGADDYLTKPFRLDELLARVRGLLRRRRWDGVAGETSEPRTMRFGEVEVLFDRFQLKTSRGDFDLTTREMGLLRALIRREGEAVPRGELLEEVWGLRPDTKTRVIDSFIVRLRRYVEVDPARPQHIVSVRGHGYRFVR